MGLYKKICKNKKQIFCWIIFILYIAINLTLMLKHEPWRDEIHAWLIAKKLSIPELFTQSKFDGHPILWHLILMPFAKLNFPIITLNIISLIIMIISTWIFIFKTKINMLLKTFATLFIPFTYFFTAISRNYCLIILILMIIGIVYEKRYQNIIIYSLLICLLIHTHALAWGIVAGLTITFHFYEIYLYLKGKRNKANMRKILIGLFFIILNTLIVIFELIGSTNINCNSIVGKNDQMVYYAIFIQILILLFILIYNLIVYKKFFKEYLVLFFGFLFQIIIYIFYYPVVLSQRIILIYSYLIFYMIIKSASTGEKEEFKQKILECVCIAIIFIYSFQTYMENIYLDYNINYSSAQQMGEYINENIPKGTEILMEAAIIEQTVIPYVDESYTFYDITNNEEVTAANVADDEDEFVKALNKIILYKGSYIILCREYKEKVNSEIYSHLKQLYETEDSIVHENYKIYYIE